MRTTREHEALVRGILDNPDDDARRLVYSDWLEEHGDAVRAEFIRASVRLAGLRPKVKGRAALEARVKELEKAHQKGWLDAIGLGQKRPGTKFRRGFIEEAYYLAPSAFFGDAAALFRWHPVRRLTLHASQVDDLDDERLHDLASVPELARLDELYLWDQQSPSAEGWRALFHSPHLANLTTLAVINSSLYEDGVEGLVASPHLAGLTRLDLGHCQFGVAGARALLASPHLRRLEFLYIDECFYGDEDGEDEVLADLEKRFGDGLLFETIEETEYGEGGA